MDDRHSEQGHGPGHATAGADDRGRVRSLYERLRGPARWGPDDRRGALNYITPAEVLAACAEVRLGRTVSLAVPVEDWVTPDNPDPAQHQMKGPLGADAGPGLSFSMDRIMMNIHGNADSHIDALCHVIFDGRLYNGVAADTVTESGAAELAPPLASISRCMCSPSTRWASICWTTCSSQFTQLAGACAAADRWSFLCIIAPLRLPTGTGSPVNPIAIL